MYFQKIFIAEYKAQCACSFNVNLKVDQVSSLSEKLTLPQQALACADKNNYKLFTENLSCYLKCC